MGEYCSISHRKKPGKDSYYLYNDYMHINIYNKNIQLEREFPECPGIEEAQNIIRFEVQCLKPKLYAIIRELILTKKTAINLLAPDCCRKMLLNCYEKTLGFEPYTTIENAAKTIANSSFSKGDKEEMIKTLKLVNVKRSIWKARESLSSEYDTRKFNNQ